MPDERSIEELVEWRRTACPECGDARGWSIRPHRGTGDPEQVECQACAEFNTLLRAVARLREERDAAYDALTQLQSALTPKGGDRE